jgi:prenyltransferase beta subunit
LLPLFLSSDISGLQQPDGSFVGDKWGETDTRCVQ